MSVPVDIFLADPLIASVELPPFDPNSVAYVYTLSLDAAKTDDELLEEAFRALNIEHPPDYRQRSLSVGDVVTIGRRCSYRCAMVGWEPLSRTLLPQHGWRELVHWFRVHRRRFRPKFGRFLCRLRGCALSECQACARCAAFVYDQNFLPAPRWLNRFSMCADSLRHKCLHRCEVCRRHIWFSEARCCSEACFEDWFPF